MSGIGVLENSILGAAKKTGKSLDNSCTNQLVNRSPAFRPRRRRGPGATFRGTTPDVFGCLLDLSLGTSEKELHSFLNQQKCGLNRSEHAFVTLWRLGTEKL